MKQLCLAAAGLEWIGLCFGDSRPGNILLDLKLSDLDRRVKSGEDIVVLIEPFGLLLNKEERAGAGTYSKDRDLCYRLCLLHTPTWLQDL